MTYKIGGQLLEACSCRGPCPCWVGDDADGGACSGVIAYHYDKGQINGVDVAGLTFGFCLHFKGNVLTPKNWKIVAYVDNRASPKQKEAILAAHTGTLGGPLKDLWQLVGEVLGVYDVPVEFKLKEGKGVLRLGDALVAEMHPFTDAAGRPTKLVDTIFTTIPGSPAYPGKTSSHRANIPQHDFVWDHAGRNAILGDFNFEA